MTPMERESSTLFQLANVNSDADIALAVSGGFFLFLAALILSDIKLVASMRDYGRDDG